MEIGRRLRYLREQNGISLDEIAKRTRIDRRYLLAIENGQFHLFPSEQHVKYCLRAYAMCIGVNPQSVLQAYSLSSGATLQRMVPAAHARSVHVQSQPRLPVQRQQTQLRKRDYVEEGREKEFAEAEVVDEVKTPQPALRRSRKAKKERAAFSLFDRLLVLMAILLLICGGIVFYLRMSTDEVSLDSQPRFSIETIVSTFKLS